MWSRKRLDIGWLDLLYGVWHVVFPPNSGRIAARIEQLWPEPERMIACLSVRSGFDLLLGTQKLPPGSEVLISAVTIPDMVRILEHHGLTPVPVDLDPKLAAPPADAWEKAVTPNTRAVLVAHLFGSRVPMEPILETARRHKFLVFEDCAQAFAGVGYAGHPETDVSMFSFGVIKSTTALGGAVLKIRDLEILERMRVAQAAYPFQNRLLYLKRLIKYGMLKALSSRSISELFVKICRAFGGNYDRWVNSTARGFSGNEFFDQIRRQPSTPLLAVLERRLRRFDTRRWENHAAKGRKLTRLFQKPSDRSQRIHCPGAENTPHTYWVFPILAKEPDRLIDELAGHGFDATQGQSLYAVPGRNGSEKNASATAKDMLSKMVFLPFYPELPMHEAQKMASIIVKNSTR